MKTITAATSLLFATTMLFASCEGNNEVFEVTKDVMETTKDKALVESVTIQKLDEINRTLPAPVNDLNSRKWFNGWGNLLSNDIIGAKDGAAAGYTTGKFIGHVIPDVGSIKGGMTGGITGGLIGGIAGSYSAYKETQNDPEFNLIPEYVMNECALLKADPDAKTYFSEIEVPDSIERIGYIHNLAMDVLINSGSEVEALSNEPKFLDKEEQEEANPVITFTQFDKDVIASETYIKVYNQIICPCESLESLKREQSISDQVIERYITALKNYTSPLDYSTVVSITNQYISVVKYSTEISDENKNCLYIAFSVGVYSYKYWSNFEFGTTAAEK